MSLISLKRSSRHSVNMNISWEMAFLLGAIYRSWSSWEFGEFVITSAKDGKHRRGSLHRTDLWIREEVPSDAVDIRTRHLFRKGKYKKGLITWVKMLQKQFGPHGLRIFLHGYHDKGVPHLHLSYDEKKGKLWKWTR